MLVLARESTAVTEADIKIKANGNRFTQVRGKARRDKLVGNISEDKAKWPDCFLHSALPRVSF